jgi:hypothetical protein
VCQNWSNQAETSAKKNVLLKQWISKVPMGVVTPATATVATTTTAKTAMAEVNNPDLALHANQIQLSVRHTITVRRRIFSKVTVTKENVMMHKQPRKEEPLWINKH